VLISGCDFKIKISVGKPKRHILEKTANSFLFAGQSMSNRRLCVNIGVNAQYRAG
jgi:hypothetical protein